MWLLDRVDVARRSSFGEHRGMPPPAPPDASTRLGAGAAHREAAPAADDASVSEAPIGSPGFCPGNDQTGVELAPASMPSQLDPAAARRMLDIQNSICGDTWCEGSFEYYFYDFRSWEQRSEVTMRTYSTLEDGMPDVSGVEVSGPQFVGQVLSQYVVPFCTSPCKGCPPHPNGASSPP